MSLIIKYVLYVLLVGLMLSLLGGAAQAAPDFATEVLPIFKRSCHACHGPEKQKSGYRLDVREVAIKGGDFGEAAIIPHSAAQSPLIQYVGGKDKNVSMPPKDSGMPQLSPDEIATLRSWIDAGPQWPDELAGEVKPISSHWSFQPLVKPQLPDESLNPIDAFVRARLSARQLTPSAEADRRTLIRRLTYDLTGLPPTPEEVEQFLADESPEAYEHLVSRLLDSPRYGEQWARHWLDVAHYADTHGNDHDYARPNAWPYRDYVIRAFNDDKPYARFVSEQVAADALYVDDDPQAIVALGFLAAGPWDHTLMVTVREDTSDHKISQVLDRDDMVSTVMSTFCSLTAHCARCHNHKFDPISQHDYYSLQAVFAGVDRADRPYDSDPQVYRRRQALLARKALIASRNPAVIASLKTAEVNDKLTVARERFNQRDAQWEPLDIASVQSAGEFGTSFTRQTDGSWRVAGVTPETDAYIVVAQAPLHDVRALRLEALPDDSLPGHGPGRYDPTGNFHLAEFQVELVPSLGDEAAKRIEILRATADHSDGGDDVANTVDGRADTFWSVHPRYGERHEAVFELKDTLPHIDAGATLKIRLAHSSTHGHQLGRFRLTYCTGKLPEDQRPPQQAWVADLLRKTELTGKERRSLLLHVLAQEVERELALLPTPRMVYAATSLFTPKGSFKPSITPRPIHLLGRGELNRPQELVGPGALNCMKGFSGELSVEDLDDEAARRAALARWLIDDRNALTWRSIVNRVWHYHFGSGLCDSPNDFGRMGSTPSNPELLDWLAVWFRDEARGSIKTLHRLIVTSAAYRQASSSNTSASAIDADNRLLWRMNRNRLTAEEIRDSLLQLSGKIDFEMGGPAVVQFLDHGKETFEPADGAPAFLDYEHFPPDAAENWRRSIYRFVFRTVPDPLMDALDAPDGGALTPIRNLSTTPVQAFALLNNGFLIRQCEHVAARVALQSHSPEEQVRAMFSLMLQRAPHPDELERFIVYVRQHGLANACQVVLNSNEFIYLD